MQSVLRVTDVCLEMLYQLHTVCNVDLLDGYSGSRIMCLERPGWKLSCSVLRYSSGIGVVCLRKDRNL